MFVEATLRAILVLWSEVGGGVQMVPTRKHFLKKKIRRKRTVKEKKKRTGEKRKDGIHSLQQEGLNMEPTSWSMKMARSAEEKGGNGGAWGRAGRWHPPASIPRGYLSRPVPLKPML